MVHTRRAALHATGATALAALAGCTALESLTTAEATEYHLKITAVPHPLIESTLYEPSDRELFGDPAREALEAVLPEGEHTTDGYQPVPEDSYVEHDGTYFQLKYTVSGREPIERELIRLESVEREAVPDDAPRVDTLDQASERILTILQTHTLHGGESSLSEEVDGDAYVIRLPAEQDCELVSGTLDDEVVTITDSTAFAFRVRRTTEEISEPEYTLQALPITDSERTFKQALLATEIDVELESIQLADSVRAILEEAMSEEAYVEESPRSDSFKTVLEYLNPEGAQLPIGGSQLWYDEERYRYSIETFEG